MIYARIETQGRGQLGVKTRYLAAESWSDLFTKLAKQAQMGGAGLRWHDVKIHTISESEYHRYTHPSFF